VRLILLGPPGAGKGTRRPSFGITSAFRNLDRRHAARRGKSGHAARSCGKEVMDAGQLVSDDIIIGLVKERLKHLDCRNGYLFDGFPRTIPQAEALQRLGRQSRFRARDRRRSTRRSSAV